VVYTKKAFSASKIEAVHSSETPLTFARLHGDKSQTVAYFIFTTVRTSNLTFKYNEFVFNEAIRNKILLAVSYIEEFTLFLELRRLFLFCIYIENWDYRYTSSSMFCAKIISYFD
jgi:hypothetical protein